MPTILSRLETGNVENKSGTARLASRIHSSIRSQSLPLQPARWLPQRKAEILTAVLRGFISIVQACELYGISVEEFLSWQRHNALYGLSGLRATGRVKKRNIAFGDDPPKDAEPAAPKLSLTENE